MSEQPQHPEDPIWSRWRQRHGQGSAPRTGPAAEPEPAGNGAPAPEPRGQRGQSPPPRAERIRIGDPLEPDWAEGSAAREEPGPGPDPRSEPGSHAHGESHTHAHGEHECLEWCPICRTADFVRASFPPEVRSQLEEVQRDALVAIRTVLDHYIARIDGQDRPASRVEDIPIS